MAGMDNPENVFLDLPVSFVEMRLNNLRVTQGAKAFPAAQQMMQQALRSIK